MTKKEIRKLVELWDGLHQKSADCREAGDDDRADEILQQAIGVHAAVTELGYSVVTEARRAVK